MAVASAGPYGPYASLHLAPDRQPHQHPTAQFFTGRMPFLPPNQQRQSTEGKYSTCIVKLFIAKAISATTAETLEGTSGRVNADPLPFLLHLFYNISRYCSTRFSQSLSWFSFHLTLVSARRSWKCYKLPTVPSENGIQLQQLEGTRYTRSPLVNFFTYVRPDESRSIRYSSVQFQSRREHRSHRVFAPVAGTF